MKRHGATCIRYGVVNRRVNAGRGRGRPPRTPYDYDPNRRVNNYHGVDHICICN